MKSIPIPTKSQVERVANEVNELATKCVEDNVALLLITLARVYGFREKRLNVLIDNFKQIKEEYQNHSDDGVFDVRIAEELQSIGIDPNRLYSKHNNIKLQIQNDKKRKESKQATIKEQYEMKRLLDEMRKCL